VHWYDEFIYNEPKAHLRHHTILRFSFSSSGTTTTSVAIWLRETTTDRFQMININSSSGKISLSKTASKSGSNAMIADTTKQKMEVNGTFFVACLNVRVASNGQVPSTTFG
jgi:hypothetical protein